MVKLLVSMIHFFLKQISTWIRFDVIVVVALIIFILIIIIVVVVITGSN